MKTKALNAWLFVAVSAAMIGCSTAPKFAEERRTLHDDVKVAIDEFNQKDPGMQHLIDTAYGYAVFPSVGEGAVGLGGAYGHGELYQNNKFVGHCDVTKATLGAQLGGQTFSEIIFFQNKATFNDFISNELAFDAKASAVAAADGASATADYKKGVAVFTTAQGGLMVQAAIGGQKFSYVSDVQTMDVQR